MFAYAPDNADEVFEAVCKISPDVYKVSVDSGTCVNIDEDI